MEYFIKWLENWNARSDNTGKLTKETFSALHHTTNALLEISNYCLTELKANYVLLGKFQTDSLEARFGQYRQLAGGQYDVSLRQIYECEKKIRLLSVLNLQFQGNAINLSNFSLNCDDYCKSECISTLKEFPVNIAPADWDDASQQMPVLTYVAGYCCHSVSKVTV